jgi:hypothetical protein
MRAVRNLLFDALTHLAIAMREFTVRRSIRLNAYDSNGRDYLADKVGVTRIELESWITSPTVRPHLVLWHHICISGPRRFNHAIEWINTGEKGYFYNPEDLEEDLLFMCSGEGDLRAECEEKSDDERVSYADKAAKTGNWITQELWARTAWRIVQDNTGQEQIFENLIKEHPAACYAFVIDLLCLAFHSIAFRGSASVYKQLILGNDTSLEQPEHLPKLSASESHDEDDRLSTTSQESVGWSSKITDHSSDADFEGERDVDDASTEPSTAPEETGVKEGEDAHHKDIMAS